MDARTILARGVQEIKHPNDKSFSHNGKSDFVPEEPEVKTFGPRGINTRLRTKASQNNSYT